MSGDSVQATSKLDANLADCRIEETDLHGYWYCREHRVEMWERRDQCPLSETRAELWHWRNLANEFRQQLEDVRHRNAVLTESLAAHADEITALRNTVAALVERLLGAP